MMLCLYCQKRLGVLRRIADPKFCSDEHRQKYRSRSARALREAEELNTDDGLMSWRKEDVIAKNASTGQTATILLLVAATFLTLAIIDVPGTNISYTNPINDSVSRSSRSQNGWFDRATTSLRRQTSKNWKDDFSSGLASWGGSHFGGDWMHRDGYVRPGHLRIWTPTTLLSNYDFEFMGQIQQRSMDWAFRALDDQNYYGAKLSIAKPGPLPNAGLVRFVVLNGRERDRVELPLPLTLERGVDYQVRVRVQGNRFLTSVNGQLVSSWTDPRLTHGGIGFFSEAGEQAALKWVSVSERDSLLGRIASHFSLLTLPPDAFEAAY